MTPDQQHDLQTVLEAYLLALDAEDNDRIARTAQELDATWTTTFDLLDGEGDEELEALGHVISCSLAERCTMRQARNWVGAAILIVETL